MAISVRDRTSAPGRHGAGGGRPTTWPAGLIGALGLILLLDGLIAGLPMGPDRPSRPESSWGAAMQDASGPEAGAEILCFGDSLIKVGILPRLLEARLRRSAYNLAVVGGPPPTGPCLLRRVLDGGHRPHAIVVDFSPLMLAMAPRTNLEWWAGLIPGSERLEWALRSGDPGLAVAMMLRGALASASNRDAFRVALGLEPIADDAESDVVRALRRNWSVNRGAQVVPRPFVPVRGDGPRALDARVGAWRPHPVHSRAVDRFLDLARDRGIPVYWVIPPAEGTWIEHNERIGTIDGYRRYVRCLLARFPVLTVLDLQRAGWDRRFFRDPIHLNRDGAVRLTMAVGEALAEAETARDSGRRWIAMDGGAAVPPRSFQDLPEDLDQSRRAVSRGPSGPITMEGLK